MGLTQGHVARGADAVQDFIESYCEGPPLLKRPGVDHNLAKAYLGLADTLVGFLAWLVQAVLSFATDSADKAVAADAEKAQKFMLAGFDDVEEVLAETAGDGPFFFGATFSVVDIAFAPWLQRSAATMEVLCGIPVRDGRYPQLEQWTEAMEARPAHRALCMDRETVIRTTLASAAAQSCSPAQRALWAERLKSVMSRDMTPDSVTRTAGAEAVQCLAACRDRLVPLAAHRAHDVSPFALDALLRAAAAVALRETPPSAADAVALLSADGAPAEALAAAAVFVRSRVAMPRDGSREACRRLRWALDAVAEALIGPVCARELLVSELNAYAEKIDFGALREAATL